jgi:DNA-binding beta-propeller fold protein YncE
MKHQLLWITLASASILTACGSDENDDDGGNPDIGGGKVLLYTTDGTFIDAANVGNLPDMVTFAGADRLVVANEGEPEDDYAADAPGSISIIYLGDDKLVSDVVTLGFENSMLNGDVRIKPGSDAAHDLEPEYVTINESMTKAWVTLQENNAVAVVDLDSESIEKVIGLGKVEWATQAVDIAKDGVANPVLGVPANIFALYQPDTIASYHMNGKDYYVTANEGDDREYGDFTDVEKANDLVDANDESLLSDELQQALLDTDMEKLEVFTDLGLGADGRYHSLYMAGTRSFSIWDENGTLVFDSGAEFETYLASQYALNFNTRVDDTDDPDDIAELDEDGIPYEMFGDTAFFWDDVDARSLKKGAEPEALAVHRIDDKVFAYIGLEKQGGFFVYDITDPASPSRVQYYNRIQYHSLPSFAGDLAPEGMVAFEQNGGHYLAVAHELSSTVSLFELRSSGRASKVAQVMVGNFGEGAAEIVDYDAVGLQLFVTNAETKQVDIIDVSKPRQAYIAGHIDFSEHGDSLQSVSVSDGVVAIAVE